MISRVYRLIISTRFYAVLVQFVRKNFPNISQIFRAISQTFPRHFPKD